MILNVGRCQASLDANSLAMIVAVAAVVLPMRSMRLLARLSNCFTVLAAVALYRLSFTFSLSFTILFSHLDIVLVVRMFRRALLRLKVGHADRVRRHLHVVVLANLWEFSNLGGTNLIRSQVSHLACVQANVLLKNENVGELLMADGALMERPHWRLDAMNAHVSLQVSFGRERAATDLASERTFACVDSIMHLKCAPTRQHFLAD